MKGYIAIFRLRCLIESSSSQRYMCLQTHSGFHFRLKSSLRLRPEQLDVLLTNESFRE